MDDLLLTIAKPPFHVPPLVVRNEYTLVEALAMYHEARRWVREQQAAEEDRLVRLVRGVALSQHGKAETVDSYLDTLAKHARALLEPLGVIVLPPIPEEDRAFLYGTAALADLDGGAQ